MGSFNATCVISGLPIEAGDKVRFLALTQNRYNEPNGHACYVTGRWKPRCPPLRASYNDYGSIEHIKKRFANKVFFKSFDQDVVEKGIGDNTCHDVQVRRGMPRRDWLKALWEGRVEVEDHRRWVAPKDYVAPEPELGVPSLIRIEAVLKGAGLKVSTQYQEDVCVLDEVSPGFIRVRVDNYGAGVSDLEPIAALARGAGYPAMVTAGTGNYSRGAEVLIGPSTGSGARFHHPLGGDKDASPQRPVAGVMVREDVWQILMRTPIDTWGDKQDTFHTLLGYAVVALGEEREYRETRARLSNAIAMHALTPEAREKLENERSDLVVDHRFKVRDNHENLFWGALRGGEGVSGFGLRAAFDLACEMDPTKEELEEFLRDLVELIHVERAYSAIHGQWHPTTNSGQVGNWEGLRAFFKKISRIKSRYENEG